jgi:hypothetical protein
MRDVFNDQAKIRRVLRVGDLLGYFISTLAATLIVPIGSTFSLRSVLETFLLFALIWMVVAPFAGLFRANIALNYQQLWLVAVLTIVATPLGAWLSEVWVGQEFGLVYVLVTTAFATIVLVGWRFVLIRIVMRYLE